MLKLISGRAENQTAPTRLPKWRFFHLNTQPPKVTGTCPAATRCVHFWVKSWLFLHLLCTRQCCPHSRWATAAGPVLFTKHDSPLLTYNDVQFVRIMILQVQKGLVGPDVTIYCPRGHKRLLVQCPMRNVGTFLSD